MYENLDTAVSFTGAIADSLGESKKKKKEILVRFLQHTNEIKSAVPSFHSAFHAVLITKIAIHHCFRITSCAKVYQNNYEGLNHDQTRDRA